jgi:hypothetical protein
MLMVSISFLFPVVEMLATPAGAIYGFILYWGLIIWGVIGLFEGTTISVMIELLYKQLPKNEH